jgi:hypothetical protein
MSSESTEVEVYLCPLHPGACRMARGVCQQCGIPVRMKPERLARLQRASRLLACALIVAGLMALTAMAVGAL